MSKQNKKKNDHKKFWYVIAIGIAVLFLIVLLNSILNLGERLHRFTINDIPVFEYVWYVVSVIIVYFLIIRPLRIILFSPSLQIVTTQERDTPKAHAIYKSVAKNILKSNEGVLTEEEVKGLTEYKNHKELREGLALSLNGTVKKKIDKIIIRNANTILLSTAISQNANIDMYAVITVNIKMIKEIVEACGFRPTYKNISKLTARVATTALIAEGLENINLDDILPKSALSAIADIPLIKPILSSFTQGIANALLALRVGYVCKNYLFSDAKYLTDEEIRNKSFVEAIKSLPLVITEALKFFPKRVVKFFSKPASDMPLIED